MGKRHLGDHDSVRRMDKQGEVLIGAENARVMRERMGPKLMNGCKPEQVGTKEYGKMLKRIQIFEDGRVLDEEATNWKMEQKENYWEGIQKIEE